tara:strand:+ start:1167 stop:2192 length:1026 start_codon:yes stop_codon:yes gene_type:complete
MCQEIKSNINYLNEKRISTIYFGGGTPSLLNKNEFELLLNSIYKYHKVTKNAEITVECNPEDLIKTKLLSYKKLGVNRLSIGVQSFNNNELKFMNRSHNAEDAIESIKLAKNIGFKNISIDLIYGIPDQTLKNWNNNLNILFDLEIPHFSAYALTIEKDTKLYSLVKNKKVSLLTDKKTINQFNLLQKRAKAAGFLHYEISNFGKKEYFSKHNTSYWKMKHYLGIGPSSHSFNGISRKWNVSSNKHYINNVLNNGVYSEKETLSKEEKYNEYVFTSLRTMWGIDKRIITKRFDISFKQHLENEIIKWVRKGYLIKQLNCYQLTSKGKVFADAIASDLFIVV